MFEDKTRVLLVVPQQILDRARVFAGSATTRLKRPVSLQMVLRITTVGVLPVAKEAIVLNPTFSNIPTVPQYM